MKRLLYILPLCLGALFFTSCHVGKYLDTGERVLKNNQIRVEMADSGAVGTEIYDAVANAQQYFYQKPNKKILWVPVMMRLYCTTLPSDTSKWAEFWRRKGEAPVVYDAMASSRTASQLNALLKTKGCFNTKVTVDTIHEGQHFVKVVYNITTTNRRKIDELNYFSRQRDINNLLQVWKDGSLLKVGDYYDQQKMTQEQARLVELLKNEGYYKASPDLVHFYVDTTYDSQRLSILVTIRAQDRTEDPSKQQYSQLEKYRIGDIFIYPNISTELSTANRGFDTLVYDYNNRRGSTQYYFIYDQKITPKPKTLSQSMFIFNNMTYRPRIVANTSNALFGLHNFKFVDIRFEESDKSNDTNRLLNAKIRLLNSTRHRLSLSFELTNASDIGKSEGNIFTSGNVGLGTTLGYRNSNLFGGAEMLNIEGNLTFDFPKNVFGSDDHSFRNTFSNFESGANASLDLPSFLLPFSKHIIWQNNKPHTLFELNVNYLFRALAIPDMESGAITDVTLERRRLGGSFGYSWNHNLNVQHKLMPINISYSRLLSGSEYYNYLGQMTHDPQFAYQAVDYVLFNSHYDYTYTSQKIGTREDFNFLRLSAETAGNLLSGIDMLLGNGENNNGITYYQYVRMESEFKRYFFIGRKSTLVVRGLGGFCIPYGHSTFIPYEKMFIGGGPTTMRGWALRHLGAGQTLTSETDFALGTGEIQLVANVEHRFPIIGIFEGAIFADVGNVWSYHEWQNSNGNKFKVRNIVDGLGFDAGLGLRLNISIITLRADLAVPIYDPGYLHGQRWISDHWNWKKLVLNFGINYPF